MLGIAIQDRLRSSTFVFVRKTPQTGQLNEGLLEFLDPQLPPHIQNKYVYNMMSLYA